MTEAIPPEAVKEFMERLRLDGQIELAPWQREMLKSVLASPEKRFVLTIPTRPLRRRFVAMVERPGNFTWDGG